MLQPRPRLCTLGGTRFQSAGPERCTVWTHQRQSMPVRLGDKSPAGMRIARDLPGHRLRCQSHHRRPRLGRWRLRLYRRRFVLRIRALERLGLGCHVVRDRQGHRRRQQPEISVNRSELSNTSEFNFTEHTLSTDTKATDDAPNDVMYNYSLEAGGPDIQGVLLSTTPNAGPKPGKPFVITPIGQKLPPDGAIVSVLPHPDSYSCSATIKGRAASGTGTGGCTLRSRRDPRQAAERGRHGDL